MLNRNTVFVIALAAALAGCSHSPASYVARGDKYAAKGQYNDAVIQYRSALQKDPKYSGAYYGLGLAEIQLGNIAEAFLSMKQASALAPANRDAAVHLGDLAWWIYNADQRPVPQLYSQIDRISRSLLTTNPNDPDGIRFKADLAIADKHPDDALQLLDRANTLRPKYPDTVMPLSRLLIANSQPAKAEQLLRGMLEQNPSYSPGYDALYQLCMSQKRVNDAEQVLQLRVNKNPRSTNALMALADFYGQQRDVARLNETLKRVHDNRGRLTDARMQLAEFYAIHHDPEQALRLFQEAIKEDPKNQISYRKKVVTVLISQGKLSDAEASLNEILKLEPGDVEAQRLKAGFDLASHKQQKVADAVNIYKDLATQHPNDPDLRFYYARSLLASGDVRAARQELNDAIRQNPNNVKPKLELANLYLNQAQYDQAMRLANDVLDQVPADETAILVRAAALAGLGQRQSARSDLNRLLRNIPNDEDAELQLGLLDIADKRYADATKIFEKYYHVGQSDQRPLEGLIRGDVTQQQFGQAIDLLQREVEKSPKSNNLRLMLASVAGAAGKLDLAESQYRAIVAQSGNGSAVQFQWANLLAKAGDQKGAIEHYQAAKALDPNNSAAAALAARELEKTGDFSAAIANYREALKADPNNVFALNNLAFLLAQSGQELDQALQMALTAERLVKSNNPAVADTVGWVYLKKGLTGSALQVFQNNVRKDPNNAIYRYHLGAALLASGDKPKAKEELQRAIQGGLSKQEEPAVRQLLAKIG